MEAKSIIIPPKKSRKGLAPPMKIPAWRRLDSVIRALRSKLSRKKEGKHIDFSELPEDVKFKQLKKSGKQFIDTIKMIAYRAETALVIALKEFCLKKNDDLRSIVHEMFITEADIEPDKGKNLRL